MTVRLTSDGEEVLAAAPSLLQDRFRQELIGLEEWEQTTILATLQRIAAMMDAESLDASPLLVHGPLDEATQAAPPVMPPDKPAAESGESEAIPAQTPTVP